MVLEGYGNEAVSQIMVMTVVPVFSGDGWGNKDDRRCR
jgi:hypothetical protein